MVQTWAYIVLFIVCTSAARVSRGTRKHMRTSKSREDDWRVVEWIAESFPYVVALVDERGLSKCSGCILGKDKVLTAASCVPGNLRWVAVGVAVIRPNSTHPKNLIPITKTVQHPEYRHVQNAYDQDQVYMQNNIALVFTKSSLLELFFEKVQLGEHYLAELTEKIFSVVGFGKLPHDDKASVLMIRWYEQRPCTDPKWYYCVCGYEFDTHSTDMLEPAEGGPLILNSVPVATTAYPCGSKFIPYTSVNYNIFTIIAPYRAWINDPSSISIPRVEIKRYEPTHSSGERRRQLSSIIELCICLFVIKYMV